MDEEFLDVYNHKKNFHDVMTLEEFWQWFRGPVLGAYYGGETWYDLSGLGGHHLRTAYP